MSYLGQQLGQGQAERFVYTATGGETSVTNDDAGRAIAYTVGQVDVYLNGAKLINGSDFTATTGTSITGLAALTAADVLEVFALSIFQASDTVSASVGGTFNGNVTVDANLTVTGTVDIDTSLNVDGTVTADGLTVDGDVVMNDASPRILMLESDTTNVNTGLLQNTGDFTINTFNDASAFVATRFGIDHATGDISFYEDTGTTPKFFWDASAEALGLGTTSPSSKLHILGGGTTTTALFETAGNNTVTISRVSPATLPGSASLSVTSYGRLGISSDDYMTFATGLDGVGVTERMRITSAGDVGIGTSSPSTALHVDGIVTVDRVINATTSADPWLKGINGSGTETSFVKQDGSAYFAGNVGIGTSSPATALDVAGTVAADGLRVDGTNVVIDVGVQSSETPALEIRGNNNTANGNILRFNDEDPTTGSGQTIGKIEFYSTDQSAVVANMFAAAADPSPDGDIFFQTAEGTTLATRLKIANTGVATFYRGVVVNETSADSDFRVESDTNTHALYVDAGNSRVGVNDSNPQASFHASGTVCLADGYYIDHSNIGTVNNGQTINILLDTQGCYAYTIEVIVQCSSTAGVIGVMHRTHYVGILCSGAGFTFSGANTLFTNGLSASSASLSSSKVTISVANSSGINYNYLNYVTVKVTTRDGDGIFGGITSVTIS